MRAGDFFQNQQGLTLITREKPVNTFARRTKMTVNGTIEAKKQKWNDYG
jgi:hypothetical protein